MDSEILLTHVKYLTPWNLRMSLNLIYDKVNNRICFRNYVAAVIDIT